MHSFRKDDHAMLFNMLIVAGLAIIIFFAIVNIGSFVNSTIGQNIWDQAQVGAAGGDHVAANQFGNKVRNTTRNLSADFDDVLDSLTIAAIVMAITLPLAAVVAIRKFF